MKEEVKIPCGMVVVCLLVILVCKINITLKEHEQKEALLDKNMVIYCKSQTI
ncbi:hypothetical protein [Litchfieldia alkalitelluris]|uniref:hypothetical protein n=1 Tax=Litchfieldia alkalitelluris TaxID=304268 RepID=UPI0014758FBA|nr:hypothetical protein [Litchfieldia alkalitelluris]